MNGTHPEVLSVAELLSRCMGAVWRWKKASGDLRHKLGRAAKADTTQYSKLNKNIKNWLK